MADRAEVIERIMALRRRASNEASSVAEAEAAARIAARIIAEHGVTEAELRERGTAGIEEGIHNRHRAKPHPALKQCSFQIGEFTECVSIICRGMNKWVGQPEDVCFALYLCELIQGASERAWAAHRKKLRVVLPTDRTDFMTGFGYTCGQRLVAMARERREAQSAGTGTGLVVVKLALAESYLAERYPNLKEQPAPRKTKSKKKRSATTLWAGMHAGEKVALTRPLEQDDTEPSTALRHAP
jgi:hypothetical protein